VVNDNRGIIDEISDFTHYCRQRKSPSEARRLANQARSENAQNRSRPGAIIGAIVGGGKGAALGASIGAGAGSGIQAMSKAAQVQLPAKSMLRFRLETPLTVIPS
jgi:hypothetical protein